MANAIGLNGTHERQERYADTIVKLFRKQLVVRNEFSRDYEGNPVSGSVQVPVRNTDPTIANYDVASGVSLTQSATEYLSILVDNHKAINELIDGYEANAVPDNILAQRLSAGAYQIGLTLETSAIGELEDNGTEESSTDALTVSNVYSSIIDSVKEIKKLGVDINEIVIIVSPDTEALLLTDEKFANSSGMLGAELLREGVIGKIGGARVKMSANLSDETEYIVFAKSWAQAINEWVKEPAIYDLSNTANYIGASKLAGRMVYADKLTNENACRIKKTATVSA